MKFRETPGGLLYDVKERTLFDKKTVRRLELTKTVGVLVGRRPDAGWFEIQAVRFDKSAFDEGKAEAWIKENLEVSQQLLESVAKGEVAPAQALNISEDEQKVMATLAYASLERGNLDRARKIFQGLVALNPISNIGYTGLGKVLQAQGQNDTARENYKLALSRNGYDVDAMYGLAEIYMSKGQKKEALTPLCQILAIDPRRTELVSQKAARLVFSGYSEKEIREFVNEGQAKLLQQAKEYEQTVAAQASAGGRPASAAAPAAARAPAPAKVASIGPRRSLRA